MKKKNKEFGAIQVNDEVVEEAVNFEKEQEVKVVKVERKPVVEDRNAPPVDSRLV